MEENLVRQVYYPFCNFALRTLKGDIVAITTCSLRFLYYQCRSNYPLYFVRFAKTPSESTSNIGCKTITSIISDTAEWFKFLSETTNHLSFYLIDESICTMKYIHTRISMIVLKNFFMIIRSSYNSSKKFDRIITLLFSNCYMTLNCI